MAHSGFIFIGREDNVQCAFCGCIIGGWEEGDSPLEEHKKENASCEFVIDQTDQQQPTPEEVKDDTEETEDVKVTEKAEDQNNHDKSEDNKNIEKKEGKNNDEDENTKDDTKNTTEQTDTIEDNNATTEVDKNKNTDETRANLVKDGKAPCAYSECNAIFEKTRALDIHVERTHVKPNFTKAEILMMVMSKYPNTKMSSHEIYQKIIEEFSYFQTDVESNWKQKFRVALSQKKCFVRVTHTEWILDQNVLSQKKGGGKSSKKNNNVEILKKPPAILDFTENSNDSTKSELEASNAIDSAIIESFDYENLNKNIYEAIDNQYFDFSTFENNNDYFHLLKFFFEDKRATARMDEMIVQEIGFSEF